MAAILIQEAKDPNGNWNPIEYWQLSGCANSFLNKKIEPKGIIQTESKMYKGNFKTDIRFKLLSNNKAYYSNVLSSSIYLDQFEMPESITDYFYYKNILRLGGEDIFKKIIFLHPNGMNEYSEKIKADMERAGVKH